MTAVDPRTIALNALRQARAAGWHRAGYYWTNREGTIAVDLDREGVGVCRRAAALQPWGQQRTYRCDSPTEAIDHLVAAGILPHHLGTGYQLACEEWGAELAEVRRVDATQIEDLARQLADVTHEHNKIVKEYKDQIAELEQQLADARGHQGDSAVVDLPAVAA